MESSNLQPLKKLPGVLAFRRGHAVTDGEMFNLFKDKSKTPVLVLRHGIRGTQNVNDGKGNLNPWVKASTTGENGERSVSNIQVMETAKLDPEATGLFVRFEMMFLDLETLLDSCASGDKDRKSAVQTQRKMREMINVFLKRAKGSQGLLEVARRYARNVANGRWLWRNRTIASDVRIMVQKRNPDGESHPLAAFDACHVPLNEFGNYTQDEENLAQEILKQMKGESNHGLLVEANLTLRMAGSMEVYPSQNYVGKKKSDKGESTRFLYKLGHPQEESGGICVVGKAALRDQKIFNAIRTIDTWYPDYAENGFPIPVEPLGASLSQQEFYRKGEHSSFEIVKRLGQVDPDSEEGMFAIAVIERGGVYGVSDKENGAENGKGKKGESETSEGSTNESEETGDLT